MGDVRQFMRLVARDPEDPWLRLKLGQAFRSAGQLENAVGELERAVDLSQGHQRCKARARLSQARHERNGRVGEAMAFSTGSMWALDAAKEEADDLGHRPIGTQHVLLGLLSVPCPLVGPAFAKHGVETTAVRKVVGRLVTKRTFSLAPLPPVATEAVLHHRGLLDATNARLATTRVRHMLSSARRGAAGLDATEVEPAHLLLALLSQRPCAAQVALKLAGVDLEALKIEVAQRLESSREVVRALPAEPPVQAVPATAPPNALRVEAIPDQPAPGERALEPTTDWPGIALKLAVVFVMTFWAGTKVWPVLRFIFLDIRSQLL